MKTIALILGLLSFIGLSSTLSQIPANGLVAYYPFSGNANDMSGNNLNGTVTGAVLTADRFNNPNSAYSFGSTDQHIDFFSSDFWCTGSHTISFWFNSVYISSKDQFILTKRSSCMGGSEAPWFEAAIPNGTSNVMHIGWAGGGFGSSFTFNFTPNQWNNVVYVVDGTNSSLFLNGTLFSSQSYVPTSNTIMLRAGNHSCPVPNDDYIGLFDDFGLWDRALTQTEISALYDGCNLAVEVTPVILNINKFNNALFSASSNYSNTSYLWQSDPANIGWTNVPSNSTYSGGTLNELTINSAQIQNHQQQFRVIASSGSCIDTSEMVVLNISDTCINIVNDTSHIIVTDTSFIVVSDTNYITITDTTFLIISDTNYISVTDTLIINAVLTGISPPNNVNILKIYPNPASTHIYIDYGDFLTMAGYTITIVNSSGQPVYIQPIAQQIVTLNISDWTGPGLYLVYIFDDTSNIISTKKILIQ